MKVYKLILLISVGLLILVSCRKESEQPSEPGEIWPLKAGNRWEYKMTGPGTTGTETLTVIRDTIIDSLKWFGSGMFVYPWITNKGGGLYGYLNGQTQLIYPYPSRRNSIYWD